MVSRSVQDSTSFSSLESDIDENEEIPSDGSDPSVEASDWEDAEEEEEGGEENDEEEEEGSHGDSSVLKKDKTKKDGSPWRLQLDSSLSMQAHKLRQKEQSKASFLLTSLSQTRAAEKKKAASVKVQKRLSNDLLAFRIRLNEALRQTNRLPITDLFRLIEACDTKDSEIHPNSSVLSLREKATNPRSQDECLAPGKNSDEVPSSLPELLATVKQEAAELFLDMRFLQGSIFSRGSLSVAGEEDEEEEEEEEDLDTWEEDERKQEDNWECRRRRWRRMQMELARDREDAETGEGEEDKEKRISEKKRKTEMGVWSHVVDALWYRKAKRLCLEKIDAWHATVDPRSQSFKALSQPPSLQLQHAMTTQYSRLLARSLHSAHLPPPSSSSSSSSTSPKDSLSTQQKQGKTQVHAQCHIVGCDSLQWLWRTRREETEEDEKESEEGEAKRADPPRHYYYDDGDFYLELLKQVVKQGGALDSGDALEKEKSLLKIRNKLNRTRTDVDRRASKGRKIRYQPIEKLQNLVAAIPWQPNLDVLPGAGDPTIVDKLMSQLFANE